MRHLLRRVCAAAATKPVAGVVWGCLAATAAVALPFGLGTGFLQWQPVEDKALVAQVIAMTFISPGLTEEVVFRAAMLPHPQVDGARLPLRKFIWHAAFLPWALFVFYHLVNPSQTKRAVFWDTRFLALASVIGASCTAAYYYSNGSLLAASVVHWVPVAVWLLLLGGLRKCEPQMFAPPR